MPPYGWPPRSQELWRSRSPKRKRTSTIASCRSPRDLDPSRFRSKGDAEHLAELERLVQARVDAELQALAAELVAALLANGNGAAPATKVCRDCVRELELTAFEPHPTGFRRPVSRHSTAGGAHCSPRAPDKLRSGRGYDQGQLLDRVDPDGHVDALADHRLGGER